MLATDDEVENVQLQNLLAVVDQQHVTALHVQVDAVRHVLKTILKHVTATERSKVSCCRLNNFRLLTSHMHSAMLIMHIR